MTVILCDFDGTLTDTETMDFLYEHFASCGTQFAERWAKGEISTQEEIVSSFGTIAASRSEMERQLAQTCLIAGAAQFIRGCQQAQLPFAIVSDGLRWYIELMLRRYELQGLKIYSNQVYFQDGGFLFSWPWYHSSTPLRGVSKSQIIRRYQAGGEDVVFIGNGRSDIDAVGVADRIYARGFLAEYCRSKAVAAIEFNDFHDLIPLLPHL